MGIAVILKGRYVIVGAHASRDRQALASLHILDLIDVIAVHLVKPPAA
jgi:hypothetical protein